MSTEQEKARVREIWELTIPGRVSVTITNSQGRPQEVTAMGKGQRLRLSTLDRELAEEGVRLIEHNPFRNGMLVRVDKSGDHGPSADELSDDELEAIFELETEDFQQTVASLGEVNIRRLKAMIGAVDASKSEIDFINDLIEQRYTIGGSMPSYDEMQPKGR